MGARRRIATMQRRARLVARHHLGRTAADVASAVDDLVALHSSDPVTPYLALWARVPEFSVADLDHALYRDRSLCRLHAMRRTLFVVPSGQWSTMDAACGRDIARAERRKTERWVAQALGCDEPGPWLQALGQETLAALADGEPRGTRELTALVDGLSLRIRVKVIRTLRRERAGAMRDSAAIRARTNPPVGSSRQLGPALAFRSAPARRRRIW